MYVFHQLPDGDHLTSPSRGKTSLEPGETDMYDNIDGTVYVLCSNTLCTLPIGVTKIDRMEWWTFVPFVPSTVPVGPEADDITIRYGSVTVFIIFIVIFAVSTALRFALSWLER
jgi:hypothetical protein